MFSCRLLEGNTCSLVFGKGGKQRSGSTRLWSSTGWRRLCRGRRGSCYGERRGERFGWGHALDWCSTRVGIMKICRDSGGGGGISGGGDWCLALWEKTCACC